MWHKAPHKGIKAAMLPLQLQEHPADTQHRTQAPVYVPLQVHQTQAVACSTPCRLYRDLVATLILAASHLPAIWGPFFMASCGNCPCHMACMAMPLRCGLLTCLWMVCMHMVGGGRHALLSCTVPVVHSHSLDMRDSPSHACGGRWQACDNNLPCTCTAPHFYPCKNAQSLTWHL
jgi:hypothetical protein